MSRREFPAKVKIAAFQRADGKCETCRAFLYPSKTHFDHIVPDALGGEPTLANAQVLCGACHATKTGKHDVPAIAKAKRREAAHWGAKAPSRTPLPFGRKSPLKRKMDGSVVRRDQ
jgi:5-methylcytosine-specific restriction protein A